MACTVRMPTSVIRRLPPWLALVVAAFFSSALAAPSPPNVIFILADDVGARDLGCYGSVFHQTPHIDGLATRGMRFANASSASPSCSPTRASILTGLHPARLGITNPSCHLPTENLAKGLDLSSTERVISARPVTRLDTRHTTLATLLHSAGYRTAHFGKWHLGPAPYSPLEHGFESDWPGTNVQGPVGSTGYFAPWDFAPGVAATEGEHIEDRTAEEAAAWIRAHKDEPFFLNYWAFSAHSPWMGKTAYVDEFRALANPQNGQRNPVYAAMLRSLDDAVGRLIREVDDLGLASRTIIVFSSDNGGASFMNRENMQRFGFESPPTSNRPFRSGKASIYEGGTRVPAIVSWPGVTASGSVSDALVQSTDFFPTVLEMAGLTPPDGLDGVSQVPVLNGTAGAVRDRVFCHYPHGKVASVPGWAPSASLRMGNFKLIRFFADQDDFSDRFELYDLATDPGELKNLAGRRPLQLAEMQDELNATLRHTGAVVPRWNPNWRGFRNWMAVEGSNLATAAGIGTVSNPSQRPTLFLKIPPEGTGGKLRLRVRLRTMGPAENASLFWATAASPGISNSRKLELPLAAPATGIWSNWQTLTFDFATNSALDHLWLLASTGAETARIDWIRLSRPNGPLIKSWDF